MAVLPALLLLAVLAGRAVGQVVVPKDADPDQLVRGTPFQIQNVGDPTLCWAVSATTITLDAYNTQCRGVTVQPCEATSRFVFLWRGGDSRWGDIPAVFSAGGFGFVAPFLLTIVPNVVPCAAGSLIMQENPTGGSAIRWRSGGPMRSLDWDPTLCMAKGSGGWLWWASCDGSALQQWQVVYPGLTRPLQPLRQPPPPQPPTPPPPPPARQLPVSAPADSATAVIANLADLRAAARDASKTVFLVTAPLIVLDGTPVNITRPGATVRIVGPPCALGTGTCPRLSGGNRSGVLIAVGSIVELANLEITDAVSALSGGAVAATGTVAITVQNTAFSRCESAGNGGGLSATTLSLQVDSTTFSSTFAQGGGGAVFVSSLARVTIFRRCSFSNVSALMSGGAVVTSTGAAEFTECRFTGCRSNLRGGCISADAPNALTQVDGTVTITASSFIDTSAAVIGGAVFADRVFVTGSSFLRTSSGADGGSILAGFFVNATNSSFTDGFSWRNGGCIAAGTIGLNNRAISRGGQQSRVEIHNSVFTNCSAHNTVAWMTTRNFFSFVILGGAVSSASDMTVSGSLFRGCSAGGAGGSLFSMRSLFVTDSVFVNSTSGSFGGVGAVGNYQGTPGDIIVARTVVTDARADIDGGAFFSENNLYVTDSTFERVSARRSGGAVFSYRQGERGPDGGVISVAGSSFTDVKAARLGGAVYGSGALTVVSNCTFRNASAQLGGAVFASQRAVLNMSQFIRTSASFGGGAVKGGVVLATACTFLQSLSSLRGGSIEASTVEAAGCVFGRSTAGVSGGAIFAELGAVVSSSTFFSNSATAVTGNFTEGGGSIATAIRASDGSAQASIVVSDCDFREGTAPWGSGGALQSRNLNITRCKFVGNGAMNGGAISAVGSGSLSIWNSSLVNNTASIAGGAVHASSVEEVPGAVVRLEQTAFWDNKATGITAKGGAIAVFAANLTISGCSLLRNGAAPSGSSAVAIPDGSVGTFVVSATTSDLSSPGAGGALHAFDSVATVMSSTFLSNNAASGGGIFLAGRRASLVMGDTMLLSNTASIAGGAVEARNASLISVRRCSFISNEAQEGGAARVSHTATVTLDSISARSNRAYLNGGVLVLDDNRAVSISGSFVNNSAAAGGVAFIHNSETPPPCFVPALKESGCTVVGNRADRYGPITATEIVAATVTAPSVIRSGASLGLAVTLSDGFGNVVAGWPEMVNIFVRSSNATLEGQKSTEYKRPGQSFSGLALLGEANRVYGLNLSAVLAFQPEQPIETALTVAVQLCGGLEAYDTVLNRCACSPGAERLFSGDCACVSDFHVFTRIVSNASSIANMTGSVIHSNVSCRLCPRGSICSSGLLVPADGFWHSFPESEDVRLCPNPAACSGSRPDGTGRAEALFAYQQNALKASGRHFAISTTELIAASVFPVDGYLEQQCSEGYTGPLCAMCRPGFGRRRSVDCVRCPSLATICFTYAVLLLFNIFGLTLALRTSLVQSRRHIGSFPPLMNQVLKIALSFLMCTSLILRVQSSWPEDVANMLSLASLLGLTVDIVSVECVFGSNLFFERLLGYVLIIPAGALVTFLVAGIFFPFRRAYDDLVDMERAFQKWRGEPLVRASASLLLSDGDVSALFEAARSGDAVVSPGAPGSSADELLGIAGDDRAGAASAAGAGSSIETPHKQWHTEEPKPMAALSQQSDMDTGTAAARGSAKSMSAIAPEDALSSIMRSQLLFLERLRHALQLSAQEVSDLLGGLQRAAPGGGGGGDRRDEHDGTTQRSPRPSFARSDVTDDTNIPSASWRRDPATDSEGSSKLTAQRRKGVAPWQTISERVGVAGMNASLWFVRSRGEPARLTWTQLVDITIAVNVIGIFFMWLPVTMVILELFNCSLIDTGDGLPLPSPYTGYWLVQDTSQRCFQGKHYLYSVTVGTVGLAVIAVGIPIAAAIVTARLSKTELRDRNVITRLGFLFFGYRAKFKWWESVVMLRKALVVTTAVFAGAGTEEWTSPRLALFLVMGVLGIATVAQMLVKPHAVEALNKLEFLSLLCTTFTCFAGIFFGVPGVPLAVERLLKMAVVAFNAAMLTYAVLALVGTFIMFRVSLSEMTHHIVARSPEGVRPEIVVLRQMQLVVIEQGWLRVTECKAKVAKLCQRVMECVIWYLDAKITAGRGDTPPSLRATIDRLHQCREELSRRRSQRELQRRATLVCAWAAYGIVSRSNAERVVDFEARGRDWESPLVQEIIRAGEAYGEHLRRFRALPLAAQQRLLAAGLLRLPAGASPLCAGTWVPAVADFERAAEVALDGAETNAITAAAVSTRMRGTAKLRDSEWATSTEAPSHHANSKSSTNSAATSEIVGKANMRHVVTWFLRARTATLTGLMKGFNAVSEKFALRSGVVQLLFS